MKISLWIKGLLCGLLALLLLTLDCHEAAFIFWVLWAVFTLADFILDEWERRLNRVLRAHRANQQIDRMCLESRGTSEMAK